MVTELETTQDQVEDAADQSSQFYVTQFSKLTLILDTILTDL